MVAVGGRDNAAFSGFDPAAFCALLARVAGRPGCRFVACPDVVADAAATARLFEVWEPVIRALGLPVALVGQDGAEDLPLPWDRIDALFVGGTTDWKVGLSAAKLVREAKSRGLWVHMGRVNTRKRFRHAFHLGCDSVDGSGFCRWPDQRIPAALQWLSDLLGRPDDPGTAVRAGRYFRGSAGEPPLPRMAGWSITSVGTKAGGFVVHASPGGEPSACPHCGVSGLPPCRHGTRSATLHDTPRAGRPVRLIVRYRRFKCRACEQVFCQDIPGAASAIRCTERALRYAELARRSRPLESVAASLGISARTLRRWLRAA